MDGGAWWATVQGVTRSQMLLSDTHTHTHIFPGEEQTNLWEI